MQKLRGTYLLLDEASVTGTANIVMAAVMAEGTTTLYNAACEPYLQQLCRMLVSMGAKSKASARSLADRRRWKSAWDGAYAVARYDRDRQFYRPCGDDSVGDHDQNCQIDQLDDPDVFRRLGIRLEFRGDDIHIHPKTLRSRLSLTVRS